MKINLLKRLLFLIVPVIAPILATGENVVTVNNINYEINTETLTAVCVGPTSKDITMKDLIIPDFVDYNNHQCPVKSISSEAFYNCVGLSGTLTIGNNVTEIGEWAFFNCYGFEGSLIIPDNVFSIGDYAFEWCYGFNDSIIIGSSVDPYKEGLINIGTAAFYGCYGVSELIISSSVGYIGEAAFMLCRGLRDITCYSVAPPTCVCAQNAFDMCKTDAIFVHTLFPDRYKQYSPWSNFSNYCLLEAEDHHNCSHDPTPSDEILYIVMSSKFAICATADTDMINKNNLVIPDYIVNGGSFPVTKVGNSAFLMCQGLTGSLTIGNNVTEIGEWAFSDCTGLNGSLTIPNTVTTIGHHAFKGCSSFSSLIIGNSVLSIGDYAFSQCSSLTDVYSYQLTPPTCDFQTFDGVKKATLHVPVGTRDDYAAAIGWRVFTNIVDDLTAQSGAKEIVTDSVENIDESVLVYNLQGVKLNVTSRDGLSTLPAGIYIVNGRKLRVK